MAASKKTVKKWSQKFKPEYSQEWPNIKASAKGIYYAHCSVCRCDFSVQHGGRDDIRRHFETKKHKDYIFITMPRAPSSKRGAASKERSKQAPAAEQFAFNDDNQDEFLGDGTEDEIPSVPVKGGKKRYYEEDEEEAPATSSGAGPNLDGEMQTMLESFGADMRKSLTSKRKRLETFTQQSLKSANSKVEKIWNMQQTERKKLQGEYSKQLTTVLEQWETDVNKVKDQEEKIQNVFRQHQKLFQQTRITMAQRLKTIKLLFDQYSKTMGDLEQCHQDQQGHVQGELRKEMSMLQKKILMDTQHQEMANVRKSLQTMFF